MSKQDRENAVNAALKHVKTNAPNCQGFFFAFSYVQDGEVFHHRSTYQFPHDDVPMVLAWLKRESEKDLERARQKPAGAFGGPAAQPAPGMCAHCGGAIATRNPTGTCDHLYYPENCPTCKAAAA